MRTLLRVLIVGFAAVIALLLAAAMVSAYNARTLAASAASLVANQLVTTRLLNEVEREQQVLNAAFYRLSRTPDLVDRKRVLSDLDQTDRDITEMVGRAAGSPDASLWHSLERARMGFSNEARDLLSRRKLPSDSSRNLFVRHEEVTAVVAQLVGQTYARAIDNQRRVEQRSARLATESLALGGGCILVALICAILTVRFAARLFRQTEAQAGELSRVSWRLLETQESVARRFSHELHDELGGSLTAIKSNLAALATGAPSRERLDDCMKLVDDSMANVRELSQLLHPTILDDFGLDAGIAWLVDRSRERTGIEIDYRAGFSGRLADETETHLFRIVQEALTNIARHSGATRASIQLDRTGDRLNLKIADNGSGLKSGRTSGMGLTGMEARARSAGGALTIRSAPGQGVTIEAWAPITEPA